jgi:hypothetical protein
MGESTFAAVVGGHWTVVIGAIGPNNYKDTKP